MYLARLVRMLASAGPGRFGAGQEFRPGAAPRRSKRTLSENGNGENKLYQILMKLTFAGAIAVALFGLGKLSAMSPAWAQDASQTPPDDLYCDTV